MTRQGMQGWATTIAGLASLLAHAAPIGMVWLESGGTSSVEGAVTPTALEERRSPAGDGAQESVRANPSDDPPAEPVDVSAERRALIATARKERARGTLALGAFLVDASVLDAQERGVPLDGEEAHGRYQNRQNEFRAAMAKGQHWFSAVRAAYGDLHYRGVGGGNVAAMLLDGGGSCEPTAHLLAAALYDFGWRRDVRLRHYGGGRRAHLAAVIDTSGGAYDLASGAPAVAGGASFAAADLIEVYARAHGIDDRLRSEARPGGQRTAGSRAAQPRSAFAGAFSWASGYPPNDDDFGGVVPLFEPEGVSSPGLGDAPVPSGPAFPRGGLCLGMHEHRLTPVTMVGATGAHFVVDTYRIPPKHELGDIAYNAAEIEAQLEDLDDVADQFFALACLTQNYDSLALGLGAWSMMDLSQRAAEKAKAAAEQLEALVATHDDQRAVAVAVLAKKERVFAISGALWRLTEPAALVRALYDVHDATSPTTLLSFLWLEILQKPTLQRRVAEDLDAFPRAFQFEGLLLLAAMAEGVALDTDALEPWPGSAAARRIAADGGLQGQLRQVFESTDAAGAEAAYAAWWRRVAPEWEKDALAYLRRVLPVLRASGGGNPPQGWAEGSR
ncbi:MAG: hypothetical protein AAF928_04170 [Myxococcota bacterium]